MGHVVRVTRGVASVRYVVTGNDKIIVSFHTLAPFVCFGGLLSASRGSVETHHSELAHTHCVYSVLWHQHVEHD